MMKDIKPVEHAEAVEKICPYHPSWPNCRGKNCMAWKVINPRIERENHSGGMEMMLKTRAERGFQVIKKEGGMGSDTILILEEQGICARLVAPQD